MPFPSPRTLHPIVLPDGERHLSTVFLSAAIDHPRWTVGAYSYASSFDAPADWSSRLAPYLHPQSREHLSIGRFCQIADGVLFITASANHRRDGFSTFPFAIFDGMDPDRPSLPDGPFPDTEIGNDVWIGQGARVLPGTRIGSGVIIGAGAVIGGHIPDYTVVGGNPGKVLRSRFAPATVSRLLELSWWDWPIEHILRHEAAICGADLAALNVAAAEL
ncbi:CatB-related O-acetyltransferase [Sedimentitalea sp. XS_ASV28]|uniref:CatB-related O-acetyltransferase n=1 Tax=Sedimentitalea sp. XS_ASV28 TaxID=3241296 RepID=UPI003514210B